MEWQDSVQGEYISAGVCCGGGGGGGGGRGCLQKLVPGAA